MTHNRINDLVEYYSMALSHYTAQRETLIRDSKHYEPPLAFDLMNMNELIQSIGANYKRAKRLAKKPLEAVIV
jgi:hypothetical protein